jgi:hypothetical protein
MKIRVVGNLTIVKNQISLMAEENIIRPAEGILVEKGRTIITVNRKTFDKMSNPLQVETSMNKFGQVTFSPVIA